MKFTLTQRKQTASFSIAGLMLASAQLWLMLAAASNSALAQGTPPSWVQAFGSSGNGSNVANAIKAAPDHRLYVTGQFSGTATFGAQPLPQLAHSISSLQNTVRPARCCG